MNKIFIIIFIIQLFDWRNETLKYSLYSEFPSAEFSISNVYGKNCFA